MAVGSDSSSSRSSSPHDFNTDGLGSQGSSYYGSGCRALAVGFHGSTALALAFALAFVFQTLALGP